MVRMKYSYQLCVWSRNGFNQIITYLCCVAYMWLSSHSFLLLLNLFIIRIPAKVPDPILGPKGVRPLLLLRGFTGSAFSWTTPQSWLRQYSTDFLAFLESTTLYSISLCQMPWFWLSSHLCARRWLEPCFWVKISHLERFLQDVSECHSKWIHLLKTTSVVSLVGVVLIARPTAIFGSASHPDAHLPAIPVTGGQLTTLISPIQKGTQTERLIAIG